MKKLLLVLMLLPVFQLAKAQDVIVKWTFPTGLLGDTVQNGTNPLNLTRALGIEGAGPITITNGQATGDYAATATAWDNGTDAKNWRIGFVTTGYDHVKISSKQRAGGTNGGPRDFKLQYKVSNTGTWADLPGGTVTLANNWTTGVVANLDLPALCQDQPNMVFIRWIMTSNTDVNGGNVTATGISKLDEIFVTGMLLTGVAENETKPSLSTYPNPSGSAFTVTLPNETSEVEIFNNSGQSVYTTIPLHDRIQVEKSFPSGLYIVKATSNGRVSYVKHIVR